MSIPFVKQFDDFAEAMAVPNPNRPIQEAAASFGRSVCDSISNNPGLYAPTILQHPVIAACTPYWEANDYDPPESEPPYSGGQCPGVRYLINFTGTVPDNPPQTVGAIRTGPTTLRINRPQPGDPPPCPDGLSFTRWEWEGADGIIGLWSGCGATFSVNSVIPLDGAIDNCGDPDSVPVPGPNPAPNPGPLPPGTGPAFDIRGNPIFVLPPTFEFSPELNVDFPPGEVDLGSGTGSGPAQPPAPGAEEEGTGSGAGGGDSDFGEPPDGERWAGCCVTITSAPAGSGSIPQAEPESIYPRTIGNVRLKFSGSSGLAEYDTPLVNRQKTTCVWEPVRGLTPIGVRVNLLPGYNYAYRPYSVPLEQ